MTSAESPNQDKIITRVIEDEMKTAYVNYAMSVIVGRALPDVRDGLKPVHRRILYAMYDLGMLHNKPFKKCARIVGEVLGKYHPHGDSAVYDSLVRMAQDFSLRYPLIKGQGNFGCFTGDTKVKLVDGRGLSFLQLIKESKQGKRNFTYTVNKQGEIEIAEIKSPRLTKKQQKVMKVILDNEEEITCTLDHRFMLRNGTYREARNLKSGDSLMPLNLRRSVKEDDFKSELVEQAKLYNHKVISTQFLDKREDVYDLTIDGTHNFALASGVFVHNSIDGDNQAAMRYTEAKLNKLSEELLKNIEKETVAFKDNFDGSLKEPEVLPTVVPNLLINGSTGIAVGMATNIPPHNLTEVCDAVVALIDNPEISTEELMEIVPAPDFPTGGEIVCGSALHHAYAKGKGKVVIKSITHPEEGKIVVTQIPYMVNKEELIKQIADLVREKKVEGIRNINDESDREGIRVVIDLRRDADEQVVLNQLLKYSRLKVSFGINFLALVDNQPVVLGLAQILNHHIEHRKIVIINRTKYDLDQAEKRVHILDGLLVALDNVDAVIAGIKKSATIDEAKEFLLNTYTLSEIQAKAILEMRLQKLASLEQEKIRAEHRELLEKIADFKDILANPVRVLNIIKEEIKEIKEKYGDKRRSLITHNEDDDDFDMEDLIEEETMIVTMSHEGYVKRIGLDTYKTQRRGGKGVRAAGMKDEDFIERLYVSSTHDYLLFFTNEGQVHWQKVYQLPEGSRQAKGRHIRNIIELKEGEKVNAIIRVSDFNEGYLIMATKKGVVKKTELMDFSRPRKGGIRAITLDEGDSLVKVRHSTGDNEILLATKNGYANRFKEIGVRCMGRNARGVRGIRLKGDDEVIGMLAADEGKQILTVTQKGYGKRTNVADYRLCNRGGVGVTNIKITEKNGPVKAVMLVDGSEELMLVSKMGIGIRIKCSGISVIGRATQGVRVMRLNEGDELAATAKIVLDDEQDSSFDDDSEANELVLRAEEVPTPVNLDKGVPPDVVEITDKEFSVDEKDEFFKE